MLSFETSNYKSNRYKSVHVFSGNENIGNILQVQRKEKYAMWHLKILIQTTTD